MIFDATPFFVAKRERVQRSRQSRLPTFEVVMLRDLSVRELRRRLAGTGLEVSESLGQTVIHSASEPPGAA